MTKLGIKAKFKTISHSEQTRTSFDLKIPINYCMDSYNLDLSGFDFNTFNFKITLAKT